MIEVAAAGDADLASATPCVQQDTSGVLVVDPTPRGSERAVPLAAMMTDASRGSFPRILLRGGIYRLEGSVVLEADASGKRFEACPGERPLIIGPPGKPAVIVRGAHEIALAGLLFAGSSSVSVLFDHAERCTVEASAFLGGSTAILLQHSSHDLIRDNVIVDVTSNGIELKDGSDANLLTDNLIDGVAAPETEGGGIFLHGGDDNRIAHNTVENTSGFGIAVSNWDDATINVGNVVEFNLLRATALHSTDSGAVYLLGRSGVDTQAIIAGNVVDRVGTPVQHSVGIYLDDSTSGASVIRNVVRGAGSDAVQIHGGQDNLIENNLLDLGSGTSSAVLFQAAPLDTHPLNRQTGNRVQRNVIVSTNPAPRPFVWYDGGSPTIAHNLYVLPDGAHLATSPETTDAEPLLAPLPPGTAEAVSDYSAFEEAAAAAIGFRPIDPSTAGVRRRTGRNSAQ